LQNIGFGVGKVGQSFVFDGSSLSYVRMPTSTGVNVAQGNGFTVELWCNPNSLNGALPATVFEWQNRSAMSSIGTYLELYGDGTLHANLEDSDGGMHTVDATAGIVTLGLWQHVAMTYDRVSGVLTLYKDGVVVASQYIGNLRSGTASDLYFGIRPAGTFPYLGFGGAMDEMALYNRALSPSEIQAVYNAQNAGKCFTPTPVLISQPVSRSAYSGQMASFTISAAGTQPMSYQWSFNGSPIAGATNVMLTLNNVQTNQAGSYSVRVSNQVGSANSVAATLTVIQAVCIPPPSGLVSWWRGDGEAADATGTNNATIQNIGFAVGEVGQSFVFQGTNSSFVRIPASASLDVGQGNGFTVEFWCNPSLDNTNGSTLFEWNDGIGAGPGLVLYGDGTLHASMDSIGGLQHFADTTAGIVTLGAWQHVAMTYNRVARVLTLYKDGVIVANKYIGYTGEIRPETTGNLYFGIYAFSGGMDEMALYSRVLSPSEIQAIYNAGNAGKCFTPTPMTITSQPTSQTIAIGLNAALNVAATGTGPFTYQWSFNGSPIAGATNDTLTLPNVQTNQSGSYSVQVSSPYSTTNSVAATLTVAAVSTLPPSGIVGWWQGEGDGTDAAGNNNATLQNIGFAAGEVGQSFVFQGSSSSYVRIPASASSDVGQGNGFTVELWCNPNTTNSSYATLFEWGDGFRKNVGCHLDLYGDGTLHADLVGFYNSVDSTAGIVAPGSWQHVAMSYDRVAGVLMLYKDGVVVASNNIGVLRPSTTYDLYFGIRAGYPFPFPFSGGMDEMALYNRVLSPSEIRAIYNAGSAGKCFPVTITSQPMSVTAYSGENPSFAISANGTKPISYQWSFNGSPITGATNSTLTLNNVQTNQAGSYSVQVSNHAGSTNSVEVTLTVIQVFCTPPPSGLVSWWRGEGDLIDATGNNNGALSHGVAFASGEVGGGFSFYGFPYVSVPDSPSLDSLTSAITVEAWIKVNQFSAQGWATIISKGDSSWQLRQYGNSSTLSFSTTGLSDGELAGTRNINDGQWHHIAGVYDGTNKYIFVDGTLDVSAPATGLISQNGQPLCIGNTPEHFERGFNGLIDEVSIYNRALTASEIQSIYNAHSAGKCFTPVLPVINGQPTNQTITVGLDAAFSVAASGTGPLSYQWSFNGNAIANATNATLILNDVQLNQAGNYVVLVSSPYDSLSSAFATLSVILPPPPLPSAPQPGDTAFNVLANTNLSWTSGDTNSIELISDGGFESGTLTNWTQVTSQSGGAFYINDGNFQPFSLDGPSPDGPLPPFAGSYSALGSEYWVGAFYMYQTISIPANASSVKLTWAQRVRNFYSTFSPDQQFQVRICDTNNNVLATAFTTQPGDTLLADWVQTNYDMTAFAGQTVRVEFWVNPQIYYIYPDGTIYGHPDINVHVDNVSVKTGAPAGVFSNDVYFGTNSTPGPTEFQGSTTNTTWPLPLLAPQTTYYWQVVAHNGDATTTGPVWQFTTAPLLPPQTFNGHAVTGGGFQLQFTGTPNYPYILQTATNLSPPVNWQSILTNPADGNGYWNFTVTNLPALPAGYYRILGQ
jgi:hypothetical protein